MRKLILIILLLSSWFADAQHDLIVVNNQRYNDKVYVQPVSQIAVTGVAVTPTTYNLEVASTVQITESVLPLDATDQTGLWASSNGAVATVDQNGLVTGVASSGTTNITFTTTDGSFVDICVVTGIAAPAVTGVFDGAEGFGADWVFTSDYEVRVVTNLNNTGTGSFREAITTASSNAGVIVVFNGLSGIIELDNNLNVSLSKHLYIAGQTSENGIFIKNSASFTDNYLIRFSNDNTIVRGIGFGNDYNGTTDTVHIYDAQNVVLDRCTMLWGYDETFDIFGNWVAATNPANSNSMRTTVQNCIIGEPINSGHRLNTLVYATDDLSFYQNLFVHSAGRVPLIEADGLRVEVVRNMGYNNYIGQTHFRSYANTAEFTDVYHAIINNYEKVGTNSLGGASNAIRIMINDGGVTTPTINVYAEGNISPVRLLPTDPEYDAIVEYGETTSIPVGQRISDWATRKVDYPLADEPIITHTALETLLTGTGGAGTFTRNDVETRIINEVINSTGAFSGTSPTAPTISAGTIITDSDSDGIPDTLEGTWGDDTFGYLHSID